MTLELLVWLIFLAPVASFLLIVGVLRPLGQHLAAGWVTIAAMAVALFCSLLTLGNVMRVPGHELPLPDYTWLAVGDLQLHIGLAVDSLTAVMLIVVTSVSLLVQIYSVGYMAGDTGYSRYYAYMSLFTASRLGLVLADNLLQVSIFWEMVGLSSFLLIGFWFHRPSAAAAAKKAFVVTRLGDLGFLIALLIVFSITGTFTIHELFTPERVASLMATGFLGLTALTWVSLGLFAGAAGKSAQIPLHVWLPDAMEGPTPVSALIHAATMVAAGVYLIGRMLPLVHHSSEAMGVIAFIGAFTALIAAGLGLVMHDIKRVMAYSTISQLGYMMLALGVGGYVAAFFHLMNHAFFKALLFLGAGSVNHTTGTFDMRYMGGLKSAMPVTFWTLLIASLSLAGVPPFSGFWSKDEILASAWAVSPGLFVLALLTVFMTAFYVFRMLFMTFLHEYRGGAEAEASATARRRFIDPEEEAHGHHEAHLHESPASMTLPLIILAIPAVVSGLVNLPGLDWFGGFLGTITVHETLGEHGVEFNPLVAILSIGVAGAGIWLAWQMYVTRTLSPSTFAGMLDGRPYRFLYAKYYLDFVYEQLIVGIVLYRGLANGLALFDKYVVDGAVNGAGGLVRSAGGAVRRVETGQLQAYGLAIFLGVVVITAGVLLRG
jgi:NADH-quinone oxidoreductase subunit L